MHLRTICLQRSIAVLCGVLVVCVFAPCLGGDFLRWDDDTTIVTNPHIHRFDADMLWWSVSDLTYNTRWRPLSWLIFAGLVAVGGTTPVVFHLAALSLHGICVALLFALLRHLLRTLGAYPPEHATAASVVGALAWGLHPMRVEVVAWASSLPYSLVLLFLLGAFNLYVRGTLRCHLAALASFSAALATYPVAVAAAVAFPVYEWASGALRFACFSARDSRSRRALIRVAPFVGAAIAAGSVTLFGRLLVHTRWGSAATLEQVPLATRAARSVIAAAWYLWRPLVPRDLGPVYSVMRHVDARTVGASALCVALVGGAILLLRRRAPSLLALHGIYLAVLAPTFGLTEQSPSPQDRYTYVASVFGAIALGVTAAEALRIVQRPTRRALLVGLSIACLMGYAAMSRSQIAVWRSSEALFTHAIRSLGDDPYCADFLLRLAILHREEGDPRRALDELERCVAVRASALRPPQRLALTLYAQIANDFAARGRSQEAAAVRERLRALETSTQARPYAADR